MKGSDRMRGYLKTRQSSRTAEYSFPGQKKVHAVTPAQRRRLTKKEKQS
jgi:hypothetical protein